MPRVELSVTVTVPDDITAPERAAVEIVRDELAENVYWPTEVATFADKLVANYSAALGES